MKYLKYIKILILAFWLYWINAFINPHSYQEFWNLARILLIIILFVRPLRDIFPKCKLLQYSVLLRRELWILMWIYVLAHLVWYMIWSNMWFVDLFSSRLWDFNWYFAWWMIAWLIVFILTITSNNFSMKLLWWKKWKNLQRLVYPMFIFTVIHVAMVHHGQKFYEAIIVLITYFLIYILAFLYKRNSKTS